MGADRGPFAGVASVVDYFLVWPSSSDEPLLWRLMRHAGSSLPQRATSCPGGGLGAAGVVAAEMGAELVVSTSATARGPLGSLPHAKVRPGHLPPPSPATRSTYSAPPPSVRVHR